MKSVIYSSREILTLGQLRDALLRVYGGFQVKLSDGSTPTRLISWRGRYDEPSIAYEPEGSTTVRDLIKLIDAALAGQIFEGWKGGNYRFTKDSPVNVDNPGAYTERGVTDVLCDGVSVVLAVTDFSDPVTGEDPDA